MKEQDFGVSVKGGWPGRARNKEWKVEGKLRHPVYRDWKRVLNYALSQADATGGLPDWQQLVEKLFRPGSNRAHRKSRREFSLPIVKGPSGGYRIRRNTPDGQVVQLVAIGDYSISGFPVTAKGVDWKHPRTMQVLERSPAVQPVEPRVEQHHNDAVALDDWVSITDSLPEGIEALEAAPGTKDRMYVRVTQLLEVFNRWLDRANETAFTREKIPVEVSLSKDEKKRLKVNFDWIGFPRSNLFVEQVDQTAVTYRYIVESTSADLRRAYEVSLQRSRQSER